MKVVVYLRPRPSEPEASEAALAAQRTAVASWLAEHGATSLAEFIQPEEAGEPPRQLWTALKLCRQRSATLLIAMTDPIGSGRGFGPYSSYGHVHCVSITHAQPDPPPARPPAPPEPAEAPPPPAPVRSLREHRTGSACILTRAAFLSCGCPCATLAPVRSG